MPLTTIPFKFVLTVAGRRRRSSSSSPLVQLQRTAGEAEKTAGPKSGSWPGSLSELDLEVKARVEELGDTVPRVQENRRRFFRGAAMLVSSKLLPPQGQITSPSSCRMARFGPASNEKEKRRKLHVQ